MRAYVILPVLLSGCVTTMDPNYAVQMDAYRMTVAAQQQVEVAKANAEEARYQAMGAIAQNADSGTRGMALVALALAGKSANGGQVNINLPQAPESQQDKAYKWAALFAAPAATLIQGYFGYRTATNASDNNRETSIASYNAFGTIATAGFRSNASIANSGFNASTRLGSSALGAFATRPPSITMSIGGDGVIGNGSFAGPNSGTNSGNSGRISSPDDDHRTVTCTPTVDVPC